MSGQGASYKPLSGGSGGGHCQPSDPKYPAYTAKGKPKASRPSLASRLNLPGSKGK